ncbi:MAG: transcription elongation factor GreA [Parcubacteria group bacterium GW2011_GWA1_36_12]|nr:MAG: transcription elongation factor GreA [Parcubacteria group bacterium GW2011_GWA1_36_12]
MPKGTERWLSTGFAITETTNRHLQSQLEKLETRRGEIVNLGTDYTSGLHDDPAVVREMQQLDGSIDKIRSILNNSDVLPQRNDVDQIDVGNRVKIKFEDEDVEEMYRVGTAIDASYSSDESSWVSIESPLGKELKGKRKGEIVIYKLGLQPNKVKILDIFSE